MDETADRTSEQLVDLVGRLVDGQVGDAATFEEVERATLQTLNEMGRRSLERELQRRADAKPHQVEVEGWTWRRHMLATGTYHSLCGELKVRRFTYRPCRQRNGQTIVPLDVETGMLARCTPALAFCISQAYAIAPLRQCEDQLKAAYRAPPSRSTMERVALSIANEVVDRIGQLEPIVRKEELVPDGAHAISVGLDRTSVAMEVPREPGAEATTRRKERTLPYVRRPPPPVDVEYRMAYVATIAIVDRDARTLVTRKYSATAEEGPDLILARLLEDVKHLHQQGPHLPVVVVQDGAPELWGLMWEGLDRIGITTRKRIEVVDRFHVTEHLARVLDIQVPDPRRRASILANWNDRMDRYDGALKRIAECIEEWTRTAPPSRRRELESHHNFIDGVASCGRGDYAWLRRNGYPQASGVTEGACKSLVTARAKRSGQRWHHDGLTAALTLRSLQQSDRLTRVWPHLQAAIPAEVRAVM